MESRHGRADVRPQLRLRLWGAPGAGRAAATAGTWEEALCLRPREAPGAGGHVAATLSSGRGHVHVGCSQVQTQTVAGPPACWPPASLANAHGASGPWSASDRPPPLTPHRALLETREHTPSHMCSHAHTYTHIHTYTHAHRHTCSHKHTHAHMCVHTCSRMHTRSHTITRTHTETHIQMCIHMFTCTHAPVQTHAQLTCTHIHMHTHDRMQTHT